MRNYSSESVRLFVVREALKERKAGKEEKETDNSRKNIKQKKMRKTYMLLLLVCLVVAAGVCVEAEEHTDLQKDCFSHCWHGCFFPTSFCDAWCATIRKMTYASQRCHRKAQQYLNEGFPNEKNAPNCVWKVAYFLPNSAIGGAQQAAKNHLLYPVPTEASYKAYLAAHPEESSKTE
ncbi:hypothetical protein V8G54_029908 [Vigna mungo]|uniref:Uncharacterized protein n=1 Tax=Vigna mungo TaxID=3915 RepID=A0AAQ3MUM9_VIGMU